MKKFIKGILVGVDGELSSKRIAMLWLVFVVWSFIHIAVFFLTKPVPLEVASTLVLYDVVMIMGFGGLNVSERIWDKNDKTKTEKTDTNDTTKTP